MNPLSVSTGALTPTQDRVCTELFGRRADRPSFPAGLGAELAGLLDAGLGPLVADRQPDQPLVLTKRLLGHVHSCEGLLGAERDAGFAWTTQSALGTVAHKAVELSVTLRHRPAPLDLVEMALERLMDGSDRSIGAWLLDAPAVELAEVRGAAADWLTKFEDTFPPLQRSWRPRLESSLTVEACGGRVQLRGRVDLALGRADGTSARVLIVDFKTGRARPVHTEDLRFYALLETIRVGLPPFRLATFSLDSGTWIAEDVDTDTLLAAARRIIEGATKLLALEAGRPPVLRAGPLCRWCPARVECPAAAEQRRAEQRRAEEGRDAGDGTADVGLAVEPTGVCPTS